MAGLTVYDKYKPVEYDYVSQLPDDWQLLPNIAIFQERIEKNSLDLKPLSVSADKGIIWASDNERTKDRTSEDKSAYLIVYKEDIPYNTMLMWAGAVGYSAYKGIVSPAYTVLTKKHGVEFNAKFFHYMFRTEFYKNYAKRFSYGIVDSRLRLYYTYFKRMYSIVPPLKTQNAIVAYLDRKTSKIQEFIRKKERLIELLEEEKRNIIDSTYLKGIDKATELEKTNNDWITHIPKGWILIPLKYLTKIISKGTTPSTEGRGITDDGIRFIKAENIFYSEVVDTPEYFINERTHQILSRSQLKGNDILFVIAGATIGKVAIVPNSKIPANTNQAVSFVRLKKKADVEFCFYWLQSSFVHTNTWLTAVQAAQPNLAMEDLGNFLIPYSENDSVKSGVVTHIKEEHEKLNNAISKAKLEIQKIKEYQESLITQVVTGQLKVPELTSKEIH
jgi:type I restriction enzyme S subunit